jgi:CBS-domain-containing membrane protein
MRARSISPHGDEFSSPVEQGPDELSDLQEGLEALPEGPELAETVDEAGAGASERFPDRLATGTGQFEVPRSRLALRGSPDDPISSIMSRKVVCARPEMDASFLRARLLERGVSGAPVVDDWGRVLGVISKTDLVEHEVTSERGKHNVGEIMMPCAFTLPPEAPIGQAAALMAYEGVHRVVVVDHKGCVIGLVSTLDIARWLGWCARYAVGSMP